MITIVRLASHLFLHVLFTAQRRQRHECGRSASYQHHCVAHAAALLPTGADDDSGASVGYWRGILELREDPIGLGMSSVCANVSRNHRY
jgi:hypothetical protein